MITINYSYLIKDAESRKRIAKLQRLKNIFNLTALAVIFCPIFVIGMDIQSSVRLIVSSVSLGLFLLLESFNLYFHAVLHSLRKNQNLRADDPVDAVVLSLNEKYDAHVRKCKKVVIIVVCICIALVALITILAFAKILDDAATAIALSVVIAPSCIIAPIIVVVLQSKFALATVPQTDVLKAHFNPLDGITKKQEQKTENIFMNMAAAQKQLTYIYPDETLRKKQNKVVYLILVPSIAAGVFLGLNITEIFPPALTLVFSILTVAIVFAAIITSVVYQLRLIAAQRRLLEQDPEKNRLLLKHADISKAFNKRVNLVSLIVALVIIPLVTVIAVNTYLNEPINEAGRSNLPHLITGIGMGSLFAWVIPILPYIIVASINHRKKLRPLEQEIDQSNTVSLENQDPFDDNTTQLPPSDQVNGQK